MMYSGLRGNIRIGSDGGILSIEINPGIDKPLDKITVRMEVYDIIDRATRTMSCDLSRKDLINFAAAVKAIVERSY